MNLEILEEPIIEDSEDSEDLWADTPKKPIIKESLPHPIQNKVMEIQSKIHSQLYKKEKKAGLQQLLKIPLPKKNMSQTYGEIFIKRYCTSGQPDNESSTQKVSLPQIEKIPKTCHQYNSGIDRKVRQKSVSVVRNSTHPTKYLNIRASKSPLAKQPVSLYSVGRSSLVYNNTNSGAAPERCQPMAENIKSFFKINRRSTPLQKILSQTHKSYCYCNIYSRKFCENKEQNASFPHREPSLKLYI